MSRGFEARRWNLLPMASAVCLAMLLAPVAIAGEAEQPAAPIVQEEESQLPPVVARVDGLEITGEEFEQAMVTAMRMKAAQSAGDPNRDPNQPPAGFERDDAERVLQSMIRSKAIYVLAKKAETTVTDEEVNEAFEKTKASMPEGRFEQIMEARGFTEATVKEKLREQLISQKFYDAKTKDVTVSDEEVQQAYDELKEAGRMEKPETADVSHILILAPREGTEEEVAEAKKEIDAIRARIVEGKEDFGEVAKEVSEDEESKPRGGLYEDVPHGMMVPEFDKLLFELPLNEVSEPFQTRFGWHIMKVNGRDEAGTMDYESVKERVREAVETRAKGMAFNEYLESAVDDLKIEILLPRKEEADSTDAPSEAPEAENGEAELPDEPA